MPDTRIAGSSGPGPGLGPGDLGERGRGGEKRGGEGEVWA